MVNKLVVFLMKINIGFKRFEWYGIYGAIQFKPWEDEVLWAGAVLRALHIKAKFYNLSFNCFTSYKKKFVRPTMFDIFAARSVCSTKSSHGMKFIAEYCNLFSGQTKMFILFPVKSSWRLACITGFYLAERDARDIESEARDTSTEHEARGRRRIKRITGQTGETRRWGLRGKRLLANHYMAEEMSSKWKQPFMLN